MIVLVDNYDSFSYNLYQQIGAFCPDIRVVRNDELEVSQIAELEPQAIVLSPGPGRPSDAGVCIEVVRNLGPSTPILGVCLGHQSICEAYGGQVTYAKTLMHGKQSLITKVEDDPIFAGCELPLAVARYHSLAVDETSLPEDLRVLARADDGEVMALRHVSDPVYGLQFHPESILTPQGGRIMENFLDFAGVI
ncbi:MAG: aminodeoxychorismate/anthranilate synthase component II [Coriobacteriaceae bacterium]|nr:aminodeoxychorismate/anthranilate synthase component II [Coriobacteriaceae bacterium]